MRLAVARHFPTRLQVSWRDLALLTNDIDDKSDDRGNDSSSTDSEGDQESGDEQLPPHAPKLASQTSRKRLASPGSSPLRARLRGMRLACCIYACAPLSPGSSCTHL